MGGCYGFGRDDDDDAWYRLGRVISNIDVETRKGCRTHQKNPTPLPNLTGTPEGGLFTILPPPPRNPGPDPNPEPFREDRLDDLLFLRFTLTGLPSFAASLSLLFSSYFMIRQKTTNPTIKTSTTTLASAMIPIASPESAGIVGLYPKRQQGGDGGQWWWRPRCFNLKQQRPPLRPLSQPTSSPPLEQARLYDWPALTVQHAKTWISMCNRGSRAPAWY